jgi:hypothetical protein
MPLPVEHRRDRRPVEGHALDLLAGLHVVIKSGRSIVPANLNFSFRLYMVIMTPTIMMLRILELREVG